MPSKTTVNWLFNVIRCYLVIACFDLTIGVFQQTVVRAYDILNNTSGIYLLLLLFLFLLLLLLLLFLL